MRGPFSLLARHSDSDKVTSATPNLIQFKESPSPF